MEFKPFRVLVSGVLTAVVGALVIGWGWSPAALSGPEAPPAPAPLTLSAQSGSWQSVTSPAPDHDLYSVAMVSAGDGWAVGDSGTILHYTGGSWQTVASPTSNTLRSVAALPSGEAWAVGDSGTILHYTGGSWQTVTGPTGEYLNSVAVLPSGEGWAVGYSGTILRLTGGTWQTVASPTTNILYSVAMVSASEGWAVGYGPTILHYSGGGWQQVAFSASGVYDLYSVAAVSASDVWAVGGKWISAQGPKPVYGMLLGYRGAGWFEAPPGTIDYFLSVAMVSSSEGWAVGTRGAMLHYTGGSWQSVTPVMSYYIESVAALPSGEAWAVGDAGTILHYSAPPTPTPTPVPGLSVSPATVDILSTTAITDAVTRSLTVSTGSVGLPWSAAVTTPAPWFSISPIAGTAPSTVTLSLNKGAMAAGRYQSAIAFDAPGAQPAQQVVSVTAVLVDTLYRDYLPMTTASWAGGS